VSLSLLLELLPLPVCDAPEPDDEPVEPADEPEPIEPPVEPDDSLPEPPIPASAAVELVPVRLPAVVPDVPVPEPPVPRGLLPGPWELPIDPDPEADRLGADPALLPPFSSHAKLGRPRANNPTRTSFLRMKRDMNHSTLLRFRATVFTSQPIEHGLGGNWPRGWRAGGPA